VSLDCQMVPVIAHPVAQLCLTSTEGALLKVLNVIIEAIGATAPALSTISKSAPTVVVQQALRWTRPRARSVLREQFGMKDDDARSGEERPLLRRLRREWAGRGEAPPIAGQDGGCCVDGKSREPSAPMVPDRAIMRTWGWSRLVQHRGGKWVPGGLSSLDA